MQEEKNVKLALQLEKGDSSPIVQKRSCGPMVSKDECIVDLVLQEIKRGSFNLKSVKCNEEKHI